MDQALSAPSQELESRAQFASCEQQLELEKTSLDLQYLLVLMSYLGVWSTFIEVDLKKTR